jgi:hypothetical protein
MQYTDNPPQSARVMIDVDGVSPPKSTSISDILNGAQKSTDTRSILLINSVRGGFNIDSYNKVIEVTGSMELLIDSERYTIGGGEAEWIYGASVQDTYLIIVDVEALVQPRLFCIALNASFPPLIKPYIVGAFIFSGVSVQGVSIYNNDVKVNSEYIYGGAGSGDASPFQMGVVGEADTAIALDSAGKTLTVSEYTTITIWRTNPVLRTRYDIPPQSATWEKGNSLEYDGQYNIIADVDESNYQNSTLKAIRVGANFIASGKTFLIGGFFYDGEKIIGVSTLTNLLVDGSPVWGGSGGALTVDDIYPIMKQILEGRSGVTVAPDDISKKIYISGLINMFNPDTVLFNSIMQVRQQDGGTIKADSESQAVIGGLYMLDYNWFTSQDIAVSQGATIRISSKSGRVFATKPITSGLSPAIPFRFKTGSGEIMPPDNEYVRNELTYYSFVNTENQSVGTIDGIDVYEDVTVQVPSGASAMTFSLAWKRRDNGEMRNDPNDIIVTEIN